MSGSGLQDLTAIIWDVDNRRMLHQLRGHGAALQTGHGKVAPLSSSSRAASRSCEGGTSAPQAGQGRWPRRA